MQIHAVADPESRPKRGAARPVGSLLIPGPFEAAACGSDLNDDGVEREGGNSGDETDLLVPGVELLGDGGLLVHG